MKFGNEDIWAAHGAAREAREAYLTARNAYEDARTPATRATMEVVRAASDAAAIRASQMTGC